MLRLGLVTLAVVGTAMATAASAETAPATRFSWQEPQATVRPNGDLEWAPKPFVTEKGASLRYIDFDAGDDAKDGQTPQSAWKHHPWDAAAVGQAKECKGIQTYLFKRGVVYRGRLEAKDSGTPGNPIRLTSDPTWGSGEAAIYGSLQVTGGWKKCATAETPGSMPESEKVWYLDIGTQFNPRCVFEIAGQTINRIHIARHPTFKESNPDDVMADWFTWTDPKEVPSWDSPKTWSLNNADTKNLVQSDPHFYDGAHIWSEWGDSWGNMGLPRIFPVGKYDPIGHTIERKTIAHGKARFGHRYFIENLAAFLDSPGQYFYATKGNHAGRLYIRLPEDRDPNKSVVELGRETQLINIRDQHHIAITGLRFSFMNAPISDDPFAAYPGPTIYTRAVAMQLTGDCHDIRIANCHFLHVPGAVQGAPRLSPEALTGSFADLKNKPTRDSMEDIAITDNDIDHADAVAFEFQDGSTPYTQRNDHVLIGDLGRILILRNRIHDVASRNGTSSNGPAICVNNATMAEIAGNFIDRAWGVGIWCLGGKGGGDERNRPLIRNFVHHNKVTNVLLADNDWGGISIWQGGSTYVYDNIVYNPVGPLNFKRVMGRADACNGFAYYNDGSFKTYIFNNLALGKANDPSQWLKSNSAMMMTINFQNYWFNNTVYKFCNGLSGASGNRNTVVGNLFADISKQFYSQNAPDDVSLYMGKIKEGESAEKTSAASTLAYGSNVYYGQPTSFGRLKENAADLDAIQRNLAEYKPRLGDIGVMSAEMPLSDPKKGNFRPKPNCAAAGRGVRCFVPWSLYMTVGEWSFRRFNANPTIVLGENFFMSDEYVERGMYVEIPRNDLSVPGAKAEDFGKGSLEDWTDGALVFNGRDRYCVLKDQDMRNDYPVSQAFFEERGKRVAKGGRFTYPGSKRRTLDMDVNNFLIEAHFKTESGHVGGVLISKVAESGYVLNIDPQGRIRLAIRSDGKEACARTSSVAVNDGQWHHVVVELDRAAAKGGIAVYIDGKAAHGTWTGEMPSKAISLTNAADFLVGKGANGNFFYGAFDFLRVCRGTLTDSKTTIEELYAWEFDGPQNHDFAGREVSSRRDAGALQSQP